MANAALESSSSVQKHSEPPQDNQRGEFSGRIPQKRSNRSVCFDPKSCWAWIQSWFLVKRRQYGFFLWSHGVSVPRPIRVGVAGLTLGGKEILTHTHTCFYRNAIENMMCVSLAGLLSLPQCTPLLCLQQSYCDAYHPK